MATRVVGGSSGLVEAAEAAVAGHLDHRLAGAASSAGTSEVTTVTPARRSRWRASTSP